MKQLNLTPSRSDINAFTLYAHGVMKAFESGETIVYNIIGYPPTQECPVPSWSWGTYDYAVKKFVPFGPCDIATGMLFARNDDLYTLYVPRCVKSDAITFTHADVTYNTLFSNYYYTMDGGKTFNSCSKESN